MWGGEASSSRNHAINIRADGMSLCSLYSKCMSYYTVTVRNGNNQEGRKKEAIKRHFASNARLMPPFIHAGQGRTQARDLTVRPYGTYDGSNKKSERGRFFDHGLSCYLSEVASMIVAELGCPSISSSPSYHAYEPNFHLVFCNHVNDGGCV